MQMLNASAFVLSPIDHAELIAAIEGRYTAPPVLPAIVEPDWAEIARQNYRDAPSVSWDEIL